MTQQYRRLQDLATTIRDRLRESRRNDVGASEIVTIVIIAASMAALAITVVGAITLLVNNKVAGISL